MQFFRNQLTRRDLLLFGSSVASRVSWLKRMVLPIQCCLIFALLAAIKARAADSPRIDHIEILNTNFVTIHFDTAASRGYALQYADHLCFGSGNPLSASCTTWSNLFSVPPIPFPNHYVVPDSRTNLHRVYRLRVSP